MHRDEICRIILVLDWEIVMPIIDHKLHVFLCHTLQDKPIVRKLYQPFLFEDWIDPWSTHHTLQVVYAD